jgi:hypothetical protein
LKKPLLIDAAVFERLESLVRAERAECLLALHELRKTFGLPHVHSGLGIRKLRARTFECRGNLALRFLFQNRADCLYVFALADHDEVQRLLKTGQLD